MIIKIVFVSLLALYIYRRIVVSLVQRYYYKSQGVKFLSGIPILSDMGILVKCAQQHPTEQPLLNMIYDHIEPDSQGVYPPMIGTTLPSF